LGISAAPFSTSDYKRFVFPEKRMAVSMTTNVLKIGAEPVVQVLGLMCYQHFLFHLFKNMHFNASFGATASSLG
jgi:hypothetical protein